jgi:putative transposase
MQILTIRCKLEGNKTDRAEMAATVEAFARACQSVAREIRDFVTSQHELQAQSYRAIRERFGPSANLAIRAIARVAANRKAAKEADADRNAADNLRLLGMSVTPPGGPCCSLPRGTTTGCLESPRL